MNNREMSQLLSYIAELDGRQITPTTVQVWNDVLGDDYSLAEMREAVRQHFTESTEFLKPGHLVAQVRRVRRERLNRLPMGVRTALVDDPRGPNGTARDFAEYRRVHREVADTFASGLMSIATYQEYVDGNVPWDEFKQGLDRRRLEA